jgi:hypothetical protein
MTPVCPEPGTSACQAIRICRSEWVAWRESAGYQASGWTFCHWLALEFALRRITGTIHDLAAA